VEAATDIAVNCERQLEDFPIRQEQLPPGVTQPLHGSEWQGLWRRFYTSFDVKKDDLYTGRRWVAA